MRSAAALAMLAILTGCQPRAPLPARHGVASIDFCADQMVLGLLPKDQVKAVSFEADSDTEFSVPRAGGIPRLRPQLEDIIALRPAVVVRSYGGSPRIDRQLEAMGIGVVQLGFPASLAEVRTDVLRVGGELRADAKARELVAGFDRELVAAKLASAVRYKSASPTKTVRAELVEAPSFFAAPKERAALRQA